MSALVSAPTSRLARQMLPYLGPRLWADFLEHANRHYKAAWLGAFVPASGALRCVGLLDGTHAVAVELGWGGEGRGACDVDAPTAAAAAGEALEQLHLDHERPLRETCRWWTKQLLRAPRAWDDGHVQLRGARVHCHTGREPGRLLGTPEDEKDIWTRACVYVSASV